MAGYFYEEITFYDDNGEKDVYLLDNENNGERIVVSPSVFECNYFICEDCDKAFPIDEMHDGISDDLDRCVCNSCGESENYFYCDGHERWEDNRWRNTYYVNGLGDCCSDFVADYCHSCYECGEVWLDDDTTAPIEYSEEVGSYVCSSCWDEDEHGANPFNPNHYGDIEASTRSLGMVCGYHSSSHTRLKTTFLPDIVDGEKSYPDEKTNLISGFELEIHNNGSNPTSDAALWVSEQLNADEPYVVFEDDCTISPGMEMISRPASCAEHMRRFDKLTECCAELVHRGFNSHNSNMCGLHIHLNKKYFGNSASKIELAEAKFLYIFLKNWENMVRFSRRSRFNWCRKTYKGEGTTYKDLVKGSAARGHGTAINLQNRNTIEIRLWRGTLNPETLKATFKFTWRLAELVKTKNICEIASMTFEELLGDDPDILTYWERVKDRQLPSGYNDTCNY